MSVIKPRARGKRLVKHRTRLDEQNQEALYAYAAFLDESTEYVLNELIDGVLAKDKEFVRWRAEHPQPFVPRSAHRARNRPKAPDTTTQNTPPAARSLASVS
jgi:hypothetical protein